MAGNVFLSILFPPSSVLFRPDAEEVVSHLCVFFFCPFLSIGLGSMAAMMAETTPPPPGALASDTRVEGKTRSCIYPAGLSLFGTGKFRRALCKSSSTNKCTCQQSCLYVSIEPPAFATSLVLGKVWKSLVLGHAACAAAL